MNPDFARRRIGPSLGRRNGCSRIGQTFSHTTILEKLGGGGMGVVYKARDTDKLAYCGDSWGGLMGNIVPAVEKRLKASVLHVAGLDFEKALPEVDAINYVTRVTVATLMVNGELDFFFPLETSQRPVFELLGTPEKDKKWLVYPGAHKVPRADLVKETLDWLDRYLGPVE